MTPINYNAYYVNEVCYKVGGCRVYAQKFLTNREKEIFELLVQNNDTTEISIKLKISEKTVRNHISNVIQKLGVKGRSQAILELIRIGELTLDKPS